jgi:hypothetical protein
VLQLHVRGVWRRIRVFPQAGQWDLLRQRVGSDDPRFALEYSDAAVGRGVMTRDDDLKEFCGRHGTYKGVNVFVSITRSAAAVPAAVPQAFGGGSGGGLVGGGGAVPGVVPPAAAFSSPAASSSLAASSSSSTATRDALATARALLRVHPGPWKCCGCGVAVPCTDDHALCIVCPQPTACMCVRCHKLHDARRFTGRAAHERDLPLHTLSHPFQSVVGIPPPPQCAACGTDLVDEMDGYQCLECATVLCFTCNFDGMHRHHAKRPRAVVNGPVAFVRPSAEVMPRIRGLDCRCVAAPQLSITGGSTAAFEVRLGNCGRVAWPAACRLVHAAQYSLQHDPATAVVPVVVASGAEVTLWVTVVAPTVAGKFESQMELQTPDGVSFGGRVSLQLTSLGT